MANKQVSDLICKVGGKNKFFDMRSALVLAQPEDYAMLHGIGGKNHAPNSGITFAITDYSEGKGDKSKFVTTNVSPHVIDELLTVCRQNAGDKIGWIEDVAKLLLDIRIRVNKVYAVLLRLHVVATETRNQAVTALANIVSGKGHEKGPMADFGKALRTVKEKLAEHEANVEPKVLELENVFVRNSRTEVTHHQERVNMYRKKGEYVFVSTLDVMRREYNDAGEQRKYPWTVRIKNFWAKPNEQAGGTTSYVSSTATDIVDCFMQISDDDMHRCTYMTDHFIRVWENAVGIPLVLQGLDLKRQARQNR